MALRFRVVLEYTAPKGNASTIAEAVAFEKDFWERRALNFATAVKCNVVAVRIKKGSEAK